MFNFIDFIKGNFLHAGPIVLAGAIAVAIITERMRALLWRYPVRNMSKFFEKMSDLIMADRIPEAVSYCEKFRDKPVARVAKEALLRAHQPENLIKDGLELAVTEATQQIQRRTGYLATIANVSTLLGLFGTIVGLVHSFEAVGNASAQQRSALLAAGISTAMNATMMGLAVAIPCMIAFSYLATQGNNLSKDVEKAAVRMLDLFNQRYFESGKKGEKR